MFSMWRTCTAILTIGLLSPWPGHACSQGMIDTAFDAMAPEATDIVAVQVQSLALEADPSVPAALSDSHTFRAKIRILKHYRGSEGFTDVLYRNTRCAGLRINVGGIYLIAANASGTTIELDPHAAPILHLSGLFTFDTDLALKVSPTIKRLEAALRGEGTFAITTESARRDIWTFDPPPPVPPPE